MGENVLGRTIRLRDRRVVFVGEDHEENPRTSKFIGFKSKEGDDTKIVLSGEAYDALKALMLDPMEGMPLREFPHKKVWHVVKLDERKKQTGDCVGDISDSGRN